MAKAKATVTPPKRDPAKAPAVKEDKIETFNAVFESDANLAVDRFIEATPGIVVTNRVFSGLGDGQQVTITINYQV